MGIPARNNTPGATTTYRDDSVHTNKRTDKRTGAVTTTQSSFSVERHWCSRSKQESGRLIDLGGKRVRSPTAFYRAVVDTPSSEIFNFRSTSTSVEERTEPFSLSSDDVARSSGGFLIGHNVNQNSDAHNEAITKLLNKLGDQKVAVGQALAEARQNYDLIANSMSRVFQSYRSFRRGNWSAGWRHLGGTRRDFITGKTSTNWLLAAKFGWTPLMMDAYGAYQWFNEKPRPLLIKAKAASSRQHQFEGQTSGLRWTGDVDVSHYASVIARVNDGSVHTLAQAGLINPLSIAWELTPYSFVFDWFVPVGNVLQALTDTSGLSFVTGYSGVRGHASIRANARDTSIWTRSGGGSKTYFRFTRTGMGRFPRPGLYLKGKWFNESRGATALLLFRQLFK